MTESRLEQSGQLPAGSAAPLSHPETAATDPLERWR